MFFFYLYGMITVTIYEEVSNMEFVNDFVTETENADIILWLLKF